MSLRARLAFGLAAVLAALAASLVLVTARQRDYLIHQIDGQLRSVPRELLDFPLPPPPPPRQSDASVSAIFIGRLYPDGRLEQVIGGRLLNDEPSLDPALLTGVGRAGTTLTVAGRRTGQPFRVPAAKAADGRSWAVVALPLGETDDAIDQLGLTLGLAAAVIVAALVLTGWWIVRLGLRPIVAVTEAADAISAGHRGHRVTAANRRTEAGRLAHAFNLMLDDRDAAEARLRQFLADAAHELRTPLTSLRGYLDLQARGDLCEPTAVDEVNGRMRSETRRMADLVEDLLLLADLDQAQALVADEVDLGDVLRDAAADGRAVDPDRAIAVTTSGNLTVTGDERRLREVVGELVHNAMRYTAGDTAITLDAHRTHEGVDVAVTDAGPGLDAEEAARIFDRFYRGDPSRTRPNGGSGLGLAIARAIVEAHHGTLTLDTTPGRGCTFRIHLPADPDPGPSTRT